MYVQIVCLWLKHKLASALAIGQLYHQSATAPGCTTHLRDVRGLPLPVRSSKAVWCTFLDLPTMEWSGAWSGRSRIGEPGLQKQVGARSGFFAAHAPLTCCSFAAALRRAEIRFPIISDSDTFTLVFLPIFTV